MPLQTRIGIATGLVVVGDLIGSGTSQEQAIVGETPNLAARLQGVAEPNSVVIAATTRRLVGNLFELQDLGPQDLKGISGPVRAWAALRPASVESRFDALHATGLTELVGREEELIFFASVRCLGPCERLWLKLRQKGARLACPPGALRCTALRGVDLGLSMSPRSASRKATRPIFTRLSATTASRGGSAMSARVAAKLKLASNLNMNSMLSDAR